MELFVCGMWRVDLWRQPSFQSTFGPPDICMCCLPSGRTTDCGRRDGCAVAVAVLNTSCARETCISRDSSDSEHSKTSFEKNCFTAWASTLNMGLINKVDMVCLSPVGYGV